MEILCDLHTHSVYSDGTYTPEQILQEACRIGLGAVALTDHNTVAGLPVFLEAAEKYDIQPVCGVEFSTNYEGKELHLLGLFLSPEQFPAVTQMLMEGVRIKKESNRQLAKGLVAAGYPVDYEAMLNGSPNGQLNRANFAAELVRMGYMKDIQQAFNTVLSEAYGIYRPPKWVDVKEAIRFVRDLGAVPVIAHPFLDMKTLPAVRAFLEMAQPEGLEGMEVYHPKHSLEQRQQALDLAKEFHLLPSGGSDFHGANKPDISIGIGRGDLAVPMSFCDGLRPE